MVPAAGKKTRPAQLRGLNPPRPVQVRTDRHGAPRVVILGKTPRPVLRIRDRWRVDDTWWREPLCRMYWELELTDGQVVTLAHDRVTDRWFKQRYG